MTTYIYKIVRSFTRVRLYTMVDVKRKGIVEIVCGENVRNTLEAKVKTAILPLLSFYINTDGALKSLALSPSSFKDS